MATFTSYAGSRVMLGVALLALLAAAQCRGADAKTKKVMYTVYEQGLNVNATVELDTLSPTGRFQRGSFITYRNLVTAGPNITSAPLGTTQGFQLNTRVDSSRETENIQVYILKLDNTPLKGVLTLAGYIFQGEGAPQQIPIIGGTKDFLWARGYAEISIVTFTPGVGQVYKYKVVLKIDCD